MQQFCLVSGRFRMLIDGETGVPVSLTRQDDTSWEFLSPEVTRRGLWELELRPKQNAAAATAAPVVTLCPADNRVRLVRGELVPPEEEGRVRLRLTYHVLLGDDGRVNLQPDLEKGLRSDDAQAKTELQPAPRPDLILTAVLETTGTDEICGRVEVTNCSPEWCVTSVAYPLLGGVRGRSTGSHQPRPTRETLVYPFFAGLRFDDPVTTLVSKFPGPTGLGVVIARPVAERPGLFRLEQPYCGQLSMAWMDYFTRAGKSGETAGDRVSGDSTDGDGAAGLYLASYDPDGRMVSLRVDVEPAGVTRTLGMGIVHPVRVETGETWASGPVAVALHAGDWHWGARRYRAFARRALRPRPQPAPADAPALSRGQNVAAAAGVSSKAESDTLPLPSRRPAWLEHSDSLMAHYDFKWQDGSFTHTFADLYPLYQRAEADGVGHLFVAGWSSGGFDHLYPEYYPDLSLGTVMDFVNGVRQIRRSGGQVTFYTNAALFGTDSHYHPTLGERWAVRKHDLSPVRLHFFDKDFTVNCRGAAAYQRQIIDTVRWLVGEAGASGVYLDCYAAIGPYPCFSAEHGHPHPFTWNADARQLLQHLNDELTRNQLDPFLMIEGCGDQYGPFLSAVLIHGWFYAYSYPEMYKYTFPEFLTVDMVYPAHGQRFRGQGISDLAYDQLHRALILGCILWFYDQEDARFCNFRTDPEMWQYIRQLLRVRAMVRPFLQRGEFLDDEGVEVALGIGRTPVVVKAETEPEARRATKAEPAEPEAGAVTPPVDAANAGSTWRPYKGQPVVVKRFELRQPAAATEAAAELPLTTGTLLAVWRRGAESLSTPRTPAEVQAAAGLPDSSEANGFIRLRARTGDGSSPRASKPRAWLLTASQSQFEPWPVELEAAGDDTSGSTLLLPLPPAPIAMILVEE